MNTSSAMLNKSALCSLLGISLRGLENLVKRGEFPPPVRIGRCVYWSTVAVERWRARMFVAQESWSPAESHEMPAVRKKRPRSSHPRAE
jgi:predicted DNA-binding transcriptional regulator AlpA